MKEEWVESVIQVVRCYDHMIIKMMSGMKTACIFSVCSASWKARRKKDFWEKILDRI